ncbi:MAG: 6-bladed beta-propeller [Gemmatimonadota bacterium]
MKRPNTPVGIALASLTLAGCGAEEGEWRGTVEDSAGVPIVVSTDAGLWGRGGGWTVAQDLVIGAAEGEPEYQFGQISGMDVGEDGRIYVVDQQASEVRVFGADGEYLLTIGTAGSGPGELSQGAGPIFVGPGDTVRVPDLAQQRVNVYAPTGEPVGSFPVAMTEGISAKWMETPDSDLLQQAMVMQLPGQEDVEPRNLLLRRDRTGAVVDTVLDMPVGETVSFVGGRPSFRIFEPEAMWTIAPDGRLFFGVNSEYSLQVYSPEGDLERVIRKAVERRPVSDNDEAEYRRIFEGLWRDQGVAAEAMGVLTQGLGFAEHYPAYANLLGGPDGTLWLQRLQTPDDMTEQGGTFDIMDMGSASWEVFDREGRFLGVVEMPPRFTPMLFAGDTVYGVLRDDLDVQYVARLRVNRGPELAAG